MTNAPDDFDQDFSEATVQRAPAAKPSMANNLAAAWQGSPLFKMFVLVVIVGALAAAAIAIFSGNEKDIPGTSVRSAPGLTEAPGAKAPPAYVDAVNDASVKRAEEALQQGKSAIPTPVSGDETKAGLGDQGDESQYDPLAEFRPNTPQDAAPATQQDQTPVETVDSELLSKMQSQMTNLFDSWRPAGIKTIQIQEASAHQTTPVTGTTTPNAKVIVASGSIYYGELLMEANSDAPGPIVAQILSGPFAGGRAIGAFQVTREYLIIRFTKISYKKKDYAADILAVDPNTTLGALVTEKDNRYFTRVLLPAAAAFLEGFGQALGSPSNSIVSNNGQTVVLQQSKQGVEDGLYRGLAQGATTVGGFFRDEAAATKPLIRVAVGTPMGLFFVNAVTDGNQNGRASANVIETPIQTQQQQQPAPSFSSSGALINNNTIPNTGLTTVPASSLANSGVNIIQSAPQ
ncbi:MAG: DotG/IcmE/VirB10 family protein [Alphaproteobacteria bacterium]|nr:DotG/IcmE/VirB10 family protein [Alphaproteobacteria bacterium]